MCLPRSDQSKITSVTVATCYLCHHYECALAKVLRKHATSLKIRQARVKIISDTYRCIVSCSFRWSSVLGHSAVTGYTQDHRQVTLASQPPLQTKLCPAKHINNFLSTGTKPVSAAVRSAGSQWQTNWVWRSTADRRCPAANTGLTWLFYSICSVISLVTGTVLTGTGLGDDSTPVYRYVLLTAAAVAGRAASVGQARPRKWLGRAG